MDQNQTYNFPEHLQMADHHVKLFERKSFQNAQKAIKEKNGHYRHLKITL